MVREFHRCIGAADLDGLVALMTADHRFVDAAGTVVRGRDACTSAWRGFFAAFPGYVNVVDVVAQRGDVLVAVGRSECPGYPLVEGPAIWTARIQDDQVAEWRVYDDVPAVRSGWGLPGAG